MQLPGLRPDDPPGAVEVVTVVGVMLDEVAWRMKYPPAIAAMSSTSAARTSHASLGALRTGTCACISVSPRTAAAPPWVSPAVLTPYRARKGLAMSGRLAHHSGAVQPRVLQRVGTGGS